MPLPRNLCSLLPEASDRPGYQPAEAAGAHAISPAARSPASAWSGTHTRRRTGNGLLGPKLGPERHS
mgnify:CR=1 FL=1